MRRRAASPYGQSTSRMRLASMLMALVVLGVLYQRLSDPATWRILGSDNDSTASAVSGSVDPAAREKLTPGPNDQDPVEVQAANDLFESVINRAPLKQREMKAYWRLMDWSLTEPFTQLQQRARYDIPFTQFFEQPERYRGKLVNLRLHVQRVLEYDAPANPAGHQKTWEAWGWTKESNPHWYCVVFTDAPSGLPVGTEVRAELEFVGYFLKVMTYTAHDLPRGAPLLIGRARLVSGPTPTPPAPVSVWMILASIAGLILIAGSIVWTSNRFRKPPRPPRGPGELPASPLFDETSENNPFAGLGLNQDKSDQ